MLDFLKELKDEEFDAYFFLPGDTTGQIQIEGALYKEPGVSVGGNSLGKEYHVILFKENDAGIYDVDRFDAVFTEPLEYMSSLIPENWYGMMARKTTTSNNFVQKVFDKLHSV
jgi:hypothetical protein